MSTVIVNGYAPDLYDVEREKIGRDPFLIAAALGGPDRAVLTREVSSPKKSRANQDAPDVCVTTGVAWVDDFEFWRRLDFRIE